MILASLHTPLQDKVLATEMQHRLANTFQLINSLIHFRLRTVTDEAARANLAWVVDCVSSLAVLQKRLGSAQGSNFGEYLAEMAVSWHSVAKDRGISVTVEPGDSVHPSNDTATTLALIAHELVTNSIEHAFPNDGGGEVVLKLALEADNRSAELTVTDDGCGFDQFSRRMNGSNSEDSIGLVLTQILAVRCGGSFEIRRHKPRGTRASVRFLI